MKMLKFASIGTDSVCISGSTHQGFCETLLTKQYYFCSPGVVPPLNLKFSESGSNIALATLGPAERDEAHHLVLSKKS